MILNVRYKKKRKMSKALYERVEQKMAFIVKHLEDDHPVHMVLWTEKDGEYAELSFHFHGHDVIGKSKGKNFYEAIDGTIKHATRQLERCLKKKQHLKGEVTIREMESGPNLE